MAACTDDYKDWASPMVVPQPAQVSFGDGSISTVGVIDFNSVTAEKVQVCSITAPTATEPDYTPFYTITLGNNSYDIAANGMMSAADLQNYVVELYGRRPVERDVEATVNMWLTNGSTTVKTATSGVFLIKAIPQAPVIQNAYYYVGATNGWSDSDKTYVFSNGGADPYENPVFTATIPAPYNDDGTRADNWFKIAPESAYTSGDFWNNLFGVAENGDTSTSGRLVFGDVGAFCQPASDGATMYRISINMLEETFEITPITFKVEPAYYYVGATNGWSDSDKSYVFSNGGADPYENPVYTCLVPAPFNSDGTRADNWFKIAPESAYSSGDFWNNLFGVANDGDTATSGELVFGNPGAFKQPASDGAKFYRISINVKELTYEITPLSFGEFFYEIGNESGWSTSHPLFGPNGDGKYQGYYWLDGEFKFKPNANNWNDDLEYVDGTTTSGNLTDGGGPNCPDPGAGFYQINLDAAGMTYNLLKIESVSMIGGFNSWGADLEMTYNTADGCWEVTTDAVSGEYKFRANHDWAINWGGSESNLEQDGSNLNIEAGTYKFQLYISYAGNHKVVITKQ